MEKRPPRAERLRGWLIPAALLALAPKCVLCGLAYAGLGAAVGLGGPELCGASTGSGAPWSLLLASGLGLVGIALPIIRKRVQTGPKSKPPCWTGSSTRFPFFGRGLKS